jgi:hypothetical protein
MKHQPSNSGNNQELRRNPITQWKTRKMMLLHVPLSLPVAACLAHMALMQTIALGVLQVTHPLMDQLEPIALVWTLSLKVAGLVTDVRNLICPTNAFQNAETPSKPDAALVAFRN